MLGALLVSQARQPLVWGVHVTRWDPACELLRSESGPCAGHKLTGEDVAVSGVEDDEDAAHENGVNGSDDRDADRVLCAEPDALRLAAAVDMWARGARPCRGGASVAIGRIRFLERPRHAAVPPDAPEMYGHEDSRQQRQRKYVQGVKTDQRVGPNLISAEDDELRLVAEVGPGTADAVAHGDRPESQLVPGQQVAGEGEDQGEYQQNHADDPVELARRLV